MEVLRTPDDRFTGLPGYPFRPHYTTVAGPEGKRLRIHHVDEGPPDAPPVLLLHGEPSWSYLYRTMIPVFVGAGFRAVAPDLVGFGRSDKLAAMHAYTYRRHVDWMSEWLETVDLRDMTLVAQDWGGLIGLRLVARDPSRYARVVVANTGLPTGHGTPSEAFLAWRALSQRADPFDVGRVIQGGTVTALPDDVVAAYDAPFPDESFKAGAKIFPSLVPTTTDDPGAIDNVQAWGVLSAFDKPFLTCFSDSDPITAGGDRWFRERVRGAAGQPHTVIEGAGHFLQEDRGPQWAERIVEFITATS